MSGWVDILRRVLGWHSSGVAVEPPEVTPLPVLPDLPGWELYLRHYGRDGLLKNGHIAPVSARYTNSLDRDEPLVFVLHEETYAAMATITEFDILEVMVRNRFLGVQSATGGFVRDFVGIVRGSAPDRETDDDGLTFFTWHAPEQKHLLSWRRVLWPSGVANRSTFAGVAGETAAKTVIETNGTAVASVANGRWREGDLAGMQTVLDIEADSGRGNAISLAFAGGKLLEALGRICELAGDFYTLEWQGGAAGGDHAWHATWGRGSDKSDGANRVLLSLSNGTMSRPRRRQHYAVGTVALAAGRGEGSNRQTTEVPGGDYAAGNDIELFVDARNAETEGGRTGQAQNKLEEARELSELDFDVLLTSDVFYSPVAVPGRKTYHVGDRVLASYGGDEVRRIRRALVSWERGGSEPFQVRIETELWLWD